MPASYIPQSICLSASLRMAGLALLVVLHTSVAVSEQREKTPLNELIGNDELSFDGFIDTAYSYNFNDFKPRNRAYLTQPARDREGQVNLAFLGMKLDTDNLRGRLAVQAGTSVEVNYASEEDYGVRYLQEANLGVKLGEGLWLDAGIYLAHIGLESWISRDNWSYTRLLMSDFSPYYESGAKLTYEASENLNLQLHYLNGWQNISNFDGRSALGTQIAYTFDNKAALISNAFIGNEPNGDGRGTRLFHNLIFKLAPIGHLELAAAFDIGSQQQATGGNAQWYTWALLSRYSITDSLKVSARVEQYLDSKNTIIATSSGEPFKTIGFSAGVDYEILKRLWWRNEYRSFIAEDSVFATGANGTKSTDHFLVTSLGYSF